MLRIKPMPKDPVLDALDRALLGDEDLSPEELAEIDHRAADLTANRVAAVAHADVQRGLEGMFRKAG